MIMWFIATGQGRLIHFRGEDTSWRPDIQWVEWDELKAVIQDSWCASPFPVSHSLFHPRNETNSTFLRVSGSSSRSSDPALRRSSSASTASQRSRLRSRPWTSERRGAGAASCEQRCWPLRSGAVTRGHVQTASAWNPLFFSFSFFKRFVAWSCACCMDLERLRRAWERWLSAATSKYYALPLVRTAMRSVAERRHVTQSVSGGNYFFFKVATGCNGRRTHRRVCGGDKGWVTLCEYVKFKDNGLWTLNVNADSESFRLHDSSLEVEQSVRFGSCTGSRTQEGKPRSSRTQLGRYGKARSELGGIQRRGVVLVGLNKVRLGEVGLDWEA